MGRLALPHQGRIDGDFLPGLDVLEPFIERTPNHWYWLDDFATEGFDRSAKIRWAPPGHNKVTFMVPRLLWQHANPDANHFRLLLENTCGLYTCINPEHWRPRHPTFRIPARIVLPDTVDAMPTAHPHATVTVHIKHDDALVAVCGHATVLFPLKKSAPITCEECISHWVRKNLPFTEVP